MSLDRDVNFLYELGTLRFLERQWKRFLNADFANLAEHHFRVAWIALVIAKHESKKPGDIDTEKILKMALVHDIAESRTNDVDYVARQYVKRDEEQGLKDMTEGTALANELRALWREYEDLASLEAKIVKDADHLDVDFEIEEQHARGMTLVHQPEWLAMRKPESGRTLYTKTANKMCELLWESNPHDWHVKGRNRINDGDWKNSRDAIAKAKKTKTTKTQRKK